MKKSMFVLFIMSMAAFAGGKKIHIVIFRKCTVILKKLMKKITELM